MKAITPLSPVLIEVNGAQLPEADVRALAAVRVQQELSLPSLCELTFAEHAGALARAQAITPGSSLRVDVVDFSEPLFVGQVTALEHIHRADGAHLVRVRGYDRLHVLRKRYAARTHVQVTPADLARELAGSVNLAVNAAETGPVWQTLYQHGQSDLALLQEVTERSGLYFIVWDDTLHLLTLNGRGAPLPLRLGDSLFEVRTEVNSDPACRSVVMNGWNPLEIRSYEGQSSSPRSGRSASAQASPDDVGSNGQVVLVDEGVFDERHADTVAQGILDLAVAREITVWGVAEGQPALRPGARIDLTGVQTSFAGEYVLTAVTHTIDGESGFVSEFSTVPPLPNQSVRASVATLGIVTRVDDPDSLGRVRVSLPTFGGVESDWLSVLTLGAGADKGLMILPDVDDRVLVLLTHGDPGQGIVLGGLYGAAGSPDSGVSGDAVRRFTLLTPGGQRVRMDDDQKSIRLENCDGSVLELSPESVHLLSTTDLLIEAPGQSIVVRGQTIDFERG